MNAQANFCASYAPWLTAKCVDYMIRCYLGCHLINVLTIGIKLEKTTLTS